jgi:hypothetical protein
VSKRVYWSVALALLLGLLSGCGLFGSSAEDTPTPTVQEMPGGGEPTATAPATVPPTVASTSDPWPAIIEDVVNAVQADPWAKKDWQDAKKGMEVYRNGQVKAEDESTALVGVEEGLVRVAPNTTFVYRRPDDDTLKLELDEGGQMWLNVDGLKEGGTVEVETPSAVASVRGTRFSVRDVDGNLIVSTKAGTVTVSSTAGGTVDVGPGYQTTVHPGSSPSAPMPMTPQEQMRWGMAEGSGLAVVLPVVGHSGGFAYSGAPLSSDWSPDGRYFVHSYYDSEGNGLSHVFYDAQAGEMAKSPLPSDASGIFFNPAGDSLAYQIQVEVGSAICTTAYPGELAGSARPPCGGAYCAEAPIRALEVARAGDRCFGGDGLYGWPYWSPDGEWILFYSDQGGTEAFRLRPGGGNLSPMALVRQSGEGLNLFKARPDGSDLVQLTFEGGYSIRQSWSPDGEWIAFVHTDEYTAPGDVWVMRPDGSDARRVFEGIYGDGFSHLAWSPDGEWLAVSEEGGGLWAVSTTGEDDWMVPGTEGLACVSPVWSPTDAGWPLLFQVSDSERGGLWAYSPDVAEAAWRLSDAGWGPFWAPGGEHIASAFSDQTGVDVNLFKIAPILWK